MKITVIVLLACVALATPRVYRSYKTHMEGTPFANTPLEGPVADVTKAVVNAILDRIWKYSHGEEYLQNAAPSNDDQSPPNELEGPIQDITKAVVDAVLDRFFKRKHYGVAHGAAHEDDAVSEEIPVHELNGIVADVAKEVVGAVLDHFFKRKYFGEEHGIQHGAASDSDDIVLSGPFVEVAKGIIDAVLDRLRGKYLSEPQAAPALTDAFSEDDKVPVHVLRGILSEIGKVIVETVWERISKGDVPPEIYVPTQSPNVLNDSYPSSLLMGPLGEIARGIFGAILDRIRGR